MKIALIGANGTVGQRILQEALNRGHEVAAIVRDHSSIGQTHKNLTVVTGDLVASDTKISTAGSWL